MYRIILLLFLEFSTTSCDLTIPSNFNISIPCIPDKTPQLSDSEIIWRFRPHKQDPDSEVEIKWKGNILHITNANGSNEGVYTCVNEEWNEEARVRSGRTFTLRVDEPIPVQEWKAMIIVAGYDVMLPCKTKSSSSVPNETPPVVWKREITGGMMPLYPSDMDEEHQQKDDMKHRVFWDTSPKEQDWGIKILKVSKEDAGMYYCTVKKSTETLMVELVVKDPPLPRCFGFTGPWEPCIDPDSRSWRSILQESLLHFSTSVYSQLKGSNPKTNLIFSPFSIASTLSNLLLGARGETRTKLENALKLPNEFSCVHSEMKRLKQVTKNSLSMASTIYYSPEETLGEAFINQSLEFYDAVPQMLTNDSNQNMKLVNKWVAEKTNGKITHLVDEVDPSSLFVLLNAVYFNSKWKMVFEPMNKQVQFTKFSGEEKNVAALYSSKYKLAMSYNTKLKAQVGRLPLTDKNSLYILLPPTSTEESFSLMEKNMNHTNLSEMVFEMSKMTLQTAEVTLPKIKLAVTTLLPKLLRNLGLSDLFNDPNLCALSTGDSAISDARHRAFLALTEKGVEGAAATSISLSRSFPSFTALQPFVLIVWSDEVGAPLFMGRIIDPIETNQRK
ncbi:Plasma protease C1 inhibitor [Triplophysa tibetana]|uniref:Plasma protease C1 inhibitor n=1 Tax=Triplophysa tibetana TaxID=1572043 RepID=A0A5A9NWK9_9TELE|nr:Plasma protease C1 inhibitor [Triplophysa tibetana]